MKNTNSINVELSGIKVGGDTMLYLEPNMDRVEILQRYDDGTYEIEMLSPAGRRLGRACVEEVWFTERIELKQEDGYEYANY